MLILITGKPGASKTLHAIDLIERMRAEAKKDRKVDRPVFYWNIGDVTLEGWQPMGDPATFDLAHESVEPDPSVAQKWFTMPKDSIIVLAIIVLDEAQKLFPKRATGAKVPEYIAQLETHRKAGFDVVMVSQDPTLLDAHARKLVSEHRHYRRIFNTETYHEFKWHQRAVSDPESTSEQKKSEEKRGAFPKKWYGTYRSAQVHNVKARHPWKWYGMLAGTLFGVPLLVWGAIKILTPDEPEVLATDAPGRTAVQTVAQYANPWDAQLRTARVPGVDASAPFYDQLIRPVSFPRINGCHSMRWDDGRVECKCASQQGTYLAVPVAMCLRIIGERGQFDPMRADEDARERTDSSPVEIPASAGVVGG
jgi:zona occludens toxin